MKQITLSLYTIDELPRESRKTALQECNDLNVDYDWWENTYNYFIDLSKLFGISIIYEKIWFGGFYSQGGGSSFEAGVNLLNLIKAIINGSWKADYPNIELDVIPCPIDKRVLHLIEGGYIDVYVNVETANRGTDIKINFRYCFNGPGNNNCPLIDKQMEYLENWIESTINELNYLLFQTLKKEYEYLTAEEAISETIRTNEYWFTADGKLATRIDRLSVQDKSPIFTTKS